MGHHNVQQDQVRIVLFQVFQQFQLFQMFQEFIFINQQIHLFRINIFYFFKDNNDMSCLKG